VLGDRQLLAALGGLLGGRQASAESDTCLQRR
jgi:hypothetical protein